MDQWRDKLSVFLGIDQKEIEQISGSKKHITGKLDVAVIQSLCRKGVVDDIVADYGHVIVDECYHVATLSLLHEKKIRTQPPVTPASYRTLRNSSPLRPLSVHNMVLGARVGYSICNGLDIVNIFHTMP